MNFFMLAIYAFLGTVLFGDYSEDFRHIGASCNFLIQVLLGANDPFEAMDKADNYGLGGIAAFYVGTYYLINFFVLLNMFLAIIVEAYDLAKQESESQQGSDPFIKYLSEFLGSGRAHPDLEGIDIPDEHLLVAIEDIYENEVFRMSVGQVGTPVWVEPEPGAAMEGVRGKNATIVSEDFHGDVTVRYIDGNRKGEEEHHVAKSRLRPVREEQVKLHRKSVEKIAPELFQNRSPKRSGEKMSIIDESQLQTHTRFYLMNKGTSTEPQITLIDQPAMMVAFQTLAPTLNTKVWALFHVATSKRSKLLH